MMHVNLELKRRSLFYVFNFIIPSVFMSIVCITGFILHPQSGEKIGLQITTLLAINFFLHSISTIVPPSSKGIAKISDQNFF